MRFRYFLLLLLVFPIHLLFALSPVYAQDAHHLSVKVTVLGVTDEAGASRIEETVYWQTFQKERAIVVYNELKHLIDASNKADAQEESGVVIKKIEGEGSYEFRKTNGQGIIRDLELLDGWALIFIDKMGKGIVYFDLSSGKHKQNSDGMYEVEISTNRIKDADILGHYIGEKREGGTGRSTRNKEIWNLSIFLKKGTAKPNSRLIIQPVAVKLKTGDTIDYCAPIVYEGADYHSTQDKRMGYNFFKNDSLGKYYKSNIVLTDTADIRIEERVVYYKRDEDLGEKFKAAVFNYSLEDYHSPYLQRSYAGQYPEDPLKFIDFSIAMDPMDINFEFPSGKRYFKEEAAVKTIESDISLALRFRKGEAVLIRDSLNDIIRDSLVTELRQFENSMQSIQMSAGASPDGPDLRNAQLARERARAAANEINPYLPSGMRVTVDKEIVYTWNDVHDSLVNRGLKDEADAVQAIIASKSTQDEMDRPIADLAFYSDKIEPILEHMRNMVCSYKYATSRPLTSNEVYAKFKYYKQIGALDSLMTFSNGDYYNLYNSLDSIDQDILTEYAYRKLSRIKNYQDIPLSAFVANRKAILLNKLGTPDSTILKPFILEEDSIVFNRHKAIGDAILLMNMPSVWHNQAVTFLQYGSDDSVERASQFANQLKNSKKISHDVENLISVVNFVLYFPDEEGLDEEKKQKYQPAKEHILKSAPDNRAILYTEIPSWGERAKAPTLVRMMDDDNPKKWYMRGILYASQDSIEKCKVDVADLQEKKQILIPGFEDFRELSDSEYDELDPNERNLYENRRLEYEEARKQIEGDNDQTVQKGKEFIPYYLGYFQHCFDMDPSYMNYYMTEGHVVTEIRQKYKYKIKNIDMYRRLFDKYLKPLEGRGTLKTVDKNSVEGEKPSVPPSDTEVSEDANVSEEAVQTTE